MTCAIHVWQGVRSLEDLEALWSEIEPHRGLRLRTTAGRTRVFLSEACTAAEAAIAIAAAGPAAANAASATDADAFNAASVAVGQCARVCIAFIRITLRFAFACLAILMNAVFRMCEMQLLSR